MQEHPDTCNKQCAVRLWGHAVNIPCSVHVNEDEVMIFQAVYVTTNPVQAVPLGHSNKIVSFWFTSRIPENG